MIVQSIYNLSLTKDEHRALALLRPWIGDYWENPPNNAIKQIKTKIRQQLEDCQSVCSYCGLELKGTSRGEIEHIAAKATNFRHPEFTFTLKNLTLSCHWCNTSEKKGTKETILTKRNIYSKNEFALVHPYFDNPEEHYQWTDNHTTILIQIRNNSPKALFSINVFKLDTPEMNEHRARQIRFNEIKNLYPLSKGDEKLINNALEYKNE